MLILRGMCVGERCGLPGELAVLVTTPCFSLGKTLDTSGGAVGDGTCCGRAPVFNGGTHLVMKVLSAGQQLSQLKTV